MLNIVLVEPEIPNNTGNIGRLCVGTESRLHLIHPFGFVINDKNLKRSGLDYWVHLDVTEYQNIEEWIAPFTWPPNIHIIRFFLTMHYSHRDTPLVFSC